jgi:hypothetical protein
MSLYPAHLREMQVDFLIINFTGRYFAKADTIAKGSILKVNRDFGSLRILRKIYLKVFHCLVPVGCGLFIDNGRLRSHLLRGTIIH